MHQHSNYKNFTGLKKAAGFPIFFLLFFFAAGIQPSKAQNSNSEKGMDRNKLIPKIKKLYYADQKYRRISGMIENECIPDSVSTSVHQFNKERELADDILYDQMDKIDKKNTEKLIVHTKKYGFPGMERRNHDIPVFLVFVHSKPKYFKQIRKLIKKEYKAGHVSKFERDYIFWHLNGRKGMYPRVPYPINYRTDIAIYKGALKYR